MSVLVGAFATGAMDDIAAADPLPVPLNEIMPRLPPVPEPPRPQSFGPCRLSFDIIPLGNVTPAIAAGEMPDGIALIGSEADSTPVAAAESPLCPVQPD
jgi:hypothetical protein